LRAGAGAGRETLLHVQDLTVSFPGDEGQTAVVKGVSLEIQRGEIVGLVGESGCGKTMTALAIARLVPYPGQVSASSIAICGKDVLDASSRQLRRIVGTHLAMVFQDPMTSLNPALRIGVQLTEAARFHRSLRRKHAFDLAVQRMREVDISAPERRLRSYPHEFSGGMRQRAMIAMGLVKEASLILADEPTTALDVTVQAQVLDVLREANVRHGTGILLISHDIGVVSEICHRVLVMYAGRIVEEGETQEVLDHPAHPYTRALIAAVPDIQADRSQPLAIVPGAPPDPGSDVIGCPFAPRCPDAVDQSFEQRPRLESLPGGRKVACWVAQERWHEQRSADGDT
jgi:peptide/nickel transport system permease protein